MADKLIKGFCTKYALTMGIFHAEVESAEDGGFWSEALSTFLYKGRNFFTDRNEAERAAMEMARKEIVALRGKITRLEKLANEPKWAKENVRG